MGEEPPADGDDRLLHADSEAIQHAQSLAVSLLGPALQPAVLRAVRFDAGLVQQEPENGEVRVQLAPEHRLEVELHVRLPGEAHVVAEEAKLAAVRDDAPEVSA